MADGRILVACYSLGGHAEAAARDIAQRLGADLEAIEAPAIGRGLPGVVRALWSAIRRARPALAPARHEPGDYRLVIVAAPLWAGRAATPALSYVEAHAGELAAVAFVLTHGGSDTARAFDGLAAAARRPALARLALSDADRKSGADAEKIAAFVEEVRSAAGGD
jgi:hypothetical protein